MLNRTAPILTAITTTRLLTTLYTGPRQTQISLLSDICDCFPRNDDDKVRLGRLATAKNFRGQHIASTLLHEALRYSEELYPHQQVKISAQLYLEKFYQSFGFVSTTEPYDEDGIPHIAMIRSARISQNKGVTKITVIAILLDPGINTTR